jgi:hypothetical protein
MDKKTNTAEKFHQIQQEIVPAMEENISSARSHILAASGGALAGAVATAGIYCLTKRTVMDPVSLKNALTNVALNATGGFIKGAATTTGAAVTGYHLYQWKGKDLMQQIKADIAIEVKNDVEEKAEKVAHKSFDVAKKRLKWPVSYFITDEVDAKSEVQKPAQRN